MRNCAPRERAYPFTTVSRSITHVSVAIVWNVCETMHITLHER